MLDRLSVPRFADLVRALTGVRGGSVAPSVNQTIQPTVSVDDPSPDLELYAGIRRWVGRPAQGAGGAGEFSRAIILAPKQASSVTVVQGYRINTPTSGSVRVLNRNRFFSAPGGMVDTSVSMTLADARLHSSAALGRPTTQLLTGHDAIQYTISGFELLVPAATNQQAGYGPWILGPGDRLVFEGDVANQLLDLWCWGYERALEQGEKGYGQ